MAFVHANDAAMGVSDYERRDHDFYATEEWVSEAVIPTLKLLRPDITQVWEPACGDGAMSRVLERAYTDVFSTDLVYRGYGMKSSIDFLTIQTATHAKGAIITNPPFGDLAEQFIVRALELTKRHGGLVALLLRHEFDCASGRVPLWRHPFACKLVLTSRPRWIAGSTGSPRHNYSWFIWNWQHTGPAITTHHSRARGGKPQ